MENLIIDKKQTAFVHAVFIEKNIKELACALAKTISNDIQHSEFAEETRLFASLKEVKCEKDSNNTPCFAQIYFDICENQKKLTEISYHIVTGKFLHHSFNVDNYKKFFHEKIKENSNYKSQLIDPEDLDLVLSNILNAISLFWFKLALEK